MTSELKRQNLLRGAVMSVSLTGRDAPDPEIPVLGVRMTSATGVYDDGVPVRTIEDVEREEADRRADVAAGDAEEEQRLSTIAERNAADEAADDEDLVSGLLIEDEKADAAAADDDAPAARRPVSTARIAASFARPASTFVKSPATSTPVKDHPWRSQKAPHAQEPAQRGGNSRPVVCVDPFRIFPSEKAACRAIDAAAGSIRSAMRTGSRAGGCVWRDATAEEIDTHLPHLATAAASLRSRREQLAEGKAKTTQRASLAKSTQRQKRDRPQPTPIVLPPAPVPARPATIPSTAMLTTDMVRFISKAMLCLGRGGVTVGEAELDATIEAAKSLAATRVIIAAVDRGEAISSLAPSTRL